jgi:hypothetical protein
MGLDTRVDGGGGIHTQPNAHTPTNTRAKPVTSNEPTRLLAVEVCSQSIHAPGVPTNAPKTGVPTSAPKTGVPGPKPPPSVPTSAPKTGVPGPKPPPSVPTSAPKTGVPGPKPPPSVPTSVPKTGVPGPKPPPSVPTNGQSNHSLVEISSRSVHTPADDSINPSSGARLCVDVSDIGHAAAGMGAPTGGLQEGAGTGVPKPACPTRSMRVEFTLEWKKFQWTTPSGVENTISRDVPPVVDCFTVAVHDRYTHELCTYEPKGTKVVYDISQIPCDPMSQANPYMEHDDVVLPDTLKISLHSKRADSIVTTICKDPAKSKEPPETSTRPNSLRMHLASGWIGFAELASCYRGNEGGLTVHKIFHHNFTNFDIDIEISDAQVTIDGVTYADGPQLEAALQMHRANGRIERSMMYSMEDRANTLITNIKVIGGNIASKHQPRTDSIGHMMFQPVSLVLQHKEVCPISLMYRLYKTNMVPICPWEAMHFMCHALNLNGIPAWDATKGRPHVGVTREGGMPLYTHVRFLSTAEIVRVLHTTLQVPTYAGELVPYTADTVLNVCAETVSKMRKGTFEQKWTNDDMQATECIESPHCSPNGYDNYRAEDCEGSAAKILLIQHNVRAAFYEATVYLRDCGSPEGRARMSAWLAEKTSCNINLQQHEEYSFVVQCVVLSAVSHMCFDAKLLVIGALAANPLQEIQAAEQGHAACVAKVRWDNIEPLAAKIYQHYCNPETMFVLLKMPILEGFSAIGRRHGATKVELAGMYAMDEKSVTLERPVEDHSAKPIPPGYAPLWPAVNTDFPHVDIAADCRFFIIESTSPLHMCPIKGAVSAAQVRAMSRNKNAQDKVDPAAPTSVPMETFLKSVEVNFIKEYLDKSEDVRMQGYMHQGDDPMAQGEAPRTTEFYHTLYQMDGGYLGQIDKAGRMIIGADAEDMLNQVSAPSTRITLEQMDFPLLSPEENTTIVEEMRKQWSESRLPFVGQEAMRKMMSRWHAAVLDGTYAPENREQGIFRCNIGISGTNATKLFKDMNKGGSRYRPNDQTDHGVIAEQRVFRLGENTTILSHAVRANHLG